MIYRAFSDVFKTGREILPVGSGGHGLLQHSTLELLSGPTKLFETRPDAPVFVSGDLHNR